MSHEKRTQTTRRDTPNSVCPEGCHELYVYMVSKFRILCSTFLPTVSIKHSYSRDLKILSTWRTVLTAGFNLFQSSYIHQRGSAKYQQPKDGDRLRPLHTSPAQNALWSPLLFIVSTPTAPEDPYSTGPKSLLTLKEK